jgi:hypothetical protein
MKQPLIRISIGRGVCVVLVSSLVAAVVGIDGRADGQRSALA